MGIDNMIEDIERMEYKKALMQNKFVDMCKRESVSRGNEESGYVETLTLYKSTSFSSRRAQFSLNQYKEQDSSSNNYSLKKINNEDITDYKNELKSYKKDIKEIKKDNKKLKKDNYNITQKYKESLSINKALRDEEKRLLSTIATLKKEKQYAENALVKFFDSNIQQKNRKLAISNTEMTNKIRALDRELSQAKKGIENLKMIKTGSIDNGEVAKYKQLIVEKNNQISNMEDIFSESISAKNREINRLKSSSNIASSILDKANRERIKKAEQLENEHLFGGMKVKDIIESHSDAITTSKGILHSYGQDMSNSVYGFISLNRSAEYIFVDINGEEYNIANKRYVSKGLLKAGVPAKATILSKKQVSIDNTYVNASYNQKDDKKYVVYNKRKIKTIGEIKDIYPVTNEFKGKKILIIGSRFKNEYLKALSTAGAEVIWYESFSDNLYRIDVTAPSADVVIVCTSHISHSVVNRVKSLDDYSLDSSKYQFIEKDNRENIIHRIRYSLSNENEIYNN